LPSNVVAYEKITNFIPDSSVYVLLNDFNQLAVTL
jgi:hypothetical protein